MLEFPYYIRNTALANGFDDVGFGVENCRPLRVAVAGYRHQRFASDMVAQVDDRAASIQHLRDLASFYPIRLATFPLRRQAPDTFMKVGAVNIAVVVMLVETRVAPEIKLRVLSDHLLFDRPPRAPLLMMKAPDEPCRPRRNLREQRSSPRGISEKFACVLVSHGYLLSAIGRFPTSPPQCICFSLSGLRIT
jgi:hypothetical protein